MPFRKSSTPGEAAPPVEDTRPPAKWEFKVISGFGVGSIRVRFTMDVELFDIDAGKSAKMRVRGKAPGSAIDVVSNLQVNDAGSGGTQLNWSATSEVSGTVANVGARLMEGTARKLTEQFWTDFAQRVSQEG